ncbi:DE-cadherin [Portunus trituberculatus]|uniref:DE-cadherin n=1 Tax=Portunus trituberculatus TaxID=210409 RepID=A0A5B7EAB9_PORTR|nr:DE-cadherin [Portunus trituberculatus]
MTVDVLKTAGPGCLWRRADGFPVTSLDPLTDASTRGRRYERTRSVTDEDKGNTTPFLAPDSLPPLRAAETHPVKLFRAGNFSSLIISRSRHNATRLSVSRRIDLLSFRLTSASHPQFTLRIRVSDGTNAPAITDAVVAVVNVNDQDPVFQRSNYSFVVTENTDCSIPLGQSQSYATVMENLEPHLVEPVVLQLGDLDTDEHGCPCSLEFHASTPTALRDRFTLTPLGSFREEVAVGVTTITVVELTQDALTQSGSLRLANISAKALLQQTAPGVVRTSLYDRLRKQIANIHQISEDEVDVFSLRDAPAGEGVDVRYSCHRSPLYSAARLNGLLLGRRQQVSAVLGVDIPLVDINLCLNEATSPCGGQSCQHTLRPNLTAPLVVSSASDSLVGVDVIDDYACSCGPLEPPPSVCYPGFCINGGECHVRNNTLTCTCPDAVNYGPRCELLTARFEGNFAWYKPLTVCERSSLSLTFESRDKNGVLLYTGPTVPSPWPDYPRDFLYVILREWVVETFLDLGTGTMNISIPIEPNPFRHFQYIVTWGEGRVTAEVINCGMNTTTDGYESCRKIVPLARLPSSSSSSSSSSIISSSSSNAVPSHLLNAQGPLQVGGVASMVSFLQLADSYGWTLTPPSTSPFAGCLLELRHNDRLYDLNATDFTKHPIHPCDAPRTSRVVFGRHSIIIILASLLSLLLLVVVILCLARRGRKSLSYPDLDRELVKETMGGTDLEGFGEKDVTHFDLKFLQVTPDGYLVGDENEGPLPDVTQDACHSSSSTNGPPTQLPEGVTIGDFIKENIVKVDQQHQEVEDVRHYCVEGDEMSAASLSSLTSGSSRGDMIFDYRMDWGQKFEKLAQIYCAGTEADEGSEDDSPNALNKPSRSPPFLPLESSSELSRNGVRPSPPSPAPSSPSSSVAAGSRSSYMTKSHKRPQPPVLVTKSTASGPPTYVPQSKLSGSAQRSTVTTKGSDASCDKPEKTSKEPVVNGHLISSPGPRQCGEKATPHLSKSGTKKCDNQKTATTAKSAKGVETWC